MRIKKQLLILLLLTIVFSLKAQEVKVCVNLNTFKTYGKVKSLERNKFFNSHISPSNEFDKTELQTLKNVGLEEGRCFMLPNAGTSVANDLTEQSLQKKGKNWGEQIRKNIEFKHDMMKEIIK